MSKWLLGICLISRSVLAQEWVSLMPEADTPAEGTLAGTWTLEDGAMVGRSGADEPALWRAPGDFWNFELEAEFLAAGAATGGVLYRAHWLPIVPPAPGAFQAHGYRARIAPGTKGATGEIHEVNGRGLLVKAAVDAEEAAKQGEWNRLSVVTKGPVSTVRVNGMTTAILSDEASIGGMIALYVAGDGGQASELRFRNVRIRALGRGAAWRPLFDGKSLAGWEEWGSERWEVVNGTIQGRRGPKESEGYLATVATWRDFRVRGQFHMLGEGNYGLFYHSSVRFRDDGYPVISGVQGEVEPEYPGETGWHYESYRRGWIVPPNKKSVEAYALRPELWNEIEIRSVGNHVTSWVNGFRVTDFHDASPQLFEGAFALQLHTGAGAGIDWRELYVAE